jgi:hypothetical protein
MRLGNILDPVHQELEPFVWDDPGSLAPVLKPQHKHWLTDTIYGLLKSAGYEDPERYVDLDFTGSLTTYQYSDDSDVDISLFVDEGVWGQPAGADPSVVWKRGSIIALMVAGAEGQNLPGTTHPLQFYVVPPSIKPTDLYKPGMRSAYNLKNDDWIVPPEPGRSRDVRRELYNLHAEAVMAADKMERLLTTEPDKAVLYWHQIHQKRARDMVAGKGDYSESNIIYKMLANRGLFPKISDVSGEYIAKMADAWDDTPSFHRPREEWRPGVSGKGFLGPEGLMTWRIGPDMRPPHMEYMQRAKQELGDGPFQAFHIKPDGTLWSYGRPLPQDAQARIVEHDPRLHYKGMMTLEDPTEGESEWELGGV